MLGFLGVVGVCRRHLLLHPQLNCLDVYRQHERKPRGSFITGTMGCETPDWVLQPWYASGGALPSCGHYNSWKASWEACEWIKRLKGLSTKSLNVTDKDFCLMYCCNDGTIIAIAHQTKKIILSLCWSLSRHKHQCLCLEDSLSKKWRICKEEKCWNVEQKHVFLPLNYTWTTSFHNLFSWNPSPWFTNQSPMGHKIPDKTHKRIPSGF